jgi:hypothetical protein
MAGAIKFFNYQLLAHWRKIFSKRGAFDKFSFILVFIVLLVGYRFVGLLNQTAKSLSEGKTGDLPLLSGIIFFVWLIPAFGSQRASARLADFVYLPLTRNQFSFISLANIFAVPVSIISLTISLSVIYPLYFAQSFGIGILTLFFYCSIAAFSLTIFVRLLKIKIFRLMLFFSLTALGILSWKTNITFTFLPHHLFIETVTGRSLNLLWLAILAASSFLLAFVAVRQTISFSDQTNRRLIPSALSKISLPMRFGELIKKDFLALWKTLDCYISLLISIIYLIILFSAEVSIFGFSVAISFLIMMSGGLAFNLFGLESSESFQRLSLLPIEPKDLFIAKNKAFGLLIFSNTFFLFPLIFYKFGLTSFLLAILKTVSITFFYLAWGNGLSVRFPFKQNFYEISFGGSLPEMLTAVFLISLLSLAPDFFLLPNLMGTLLVNAGLVILSFVAYKFSLKSASAKLINEWENIALKLEN